MSAPGDFWNALPESDMLDSEANVELRLVVPLLEALGYDRNVDIDSKYPVDFQQGRKPMPGRKPEGDIVCFNGALHDRDTSLLAVEAKASNQPLPPGKVQGESYAQNLRAPLLLLTNGQEFEIWQQQASLESECVLAIAVSDLAANRGTVERLLNKTAVRDYCAGLKFKTIVEATADFGPYETAELLRLRSDPPAIARTLTVPQAGGTKIEIESGKLLGGYKSGAIVVAPSGYGKSTLARSLFKQAIEERWREHHKPVAIEASLPDIEASGVDLLPFLHQRLQAHIPGIMEQTFRDLVRTVGVTVICDSMDRTSHAFQKRVTTAISLLLRDYPLSQVFLFSRADSRPVLAIPTLQLEPLSDAQRRELEDVLLADGSAKHYSIIGAASPTLRSLCSIPLLLKLALEYWQRHREFPRDVDVLFRSWLETVLETEPSDTVSRYRREQALSLIAEATVDAPLTGVAAIALLKRHGIDETVLNELIRCNAVRETDAVLDLQHDSLADYLRAKMFAEKPVAEQLAAIPKVPTSPDSFLPVLLMAQMPDPGARDSLWRHLISGPIETYFDALRYRHDASEELRRLDPPALSYRYMTDMLDGIEEPLEGYFPVLRPAIVEWLTDERDKPLAIIGGANPYSLYYKIHAQDPGAPRVVVGAPDFPGTIRGVNLEGRFRADSARLLGMSLLKEGVEEAVKTRNLDGRQEWAAERLIGRVRYLAESAKMPISVNDDLDTVEKVLRPYTEVVLRDGPWGRGQQFSFRSLLDDIAKLRGAGLTALNPWWSRLGWNDCIPCLSEGDFARILNEEYRRAQLIYTEIVETCFPRFAKKMIWYPILPLRWKLRVVRGTPLDRTFVIYPHWAPVKDWKDAGADVTFADRGPDRQPPWEEARDALVALGRTPNVPHYGGFTTHAGYSGSQLTGHFSGATPAENEAFSWLKDEVERLFKNLPSGDGSF